MTTCPTVFIQYFHKRGPSCLPGECVIYLSPLLCNRFTTITTNTMFWRKMLLYHIVTSLKLAETGFSPRSTKASTTRENCITSDCSGLVGNEWFGGLGPSLAHPSLPWVCHIAGVIVIGTVHQVFPAFHFLGPHRAVSPGPWHLGAIIWTVPCDELGGKVLHITSRLEHVNACGLEPFFPSSSECLQYIKSF